MVRCTHVKATEAPPGRAPADAPRAPQDAPPGRGADLRPPGPRQPRWSEVAGHGTVLLQRDPDLVRSLIEWFQLTLG